MKKPNKFLISCGVLTLFGLALYVTGFLLGGRVTGIGLTNDGLMVYTMNDGTNSGGSEEYISESVRLDAFSRIDLQVIYSDIRIEESDHYGVDYRTNKDRKLTLEASNDTLTIRQKDSYKGSSFQWMFFGVDFSGFSSYSGLEEYVTIYIPSGSKLKEMALSTEYGDTHISSFYAEAVSVKDDYGDVSVSSLSSSSLDVWIESGNLALSDIVCESLNIRNAYGNIRLQKVDAGDSAAIAIESGNLDINDSSLGSVRIKNQYGDINGYTVSAADADFSLESGECNMKDFMFDSFNVESAYGDVRLSTALLDSGLSYDLYTSYGEISIDKEIIGTQYKSTVAGAAVPAVTIQCESGNIRISSNS